MILRNNHFIFEAAYSLILFIRREFLYIFVYLFDDSIRLHQTFQNVLYGFAKFLQELGQELLSPTFVTVVIIDIHSPLFLSLLFDKSKGFRALKMSSTDHDDLFQTKMFYYRFLFALFEICP